MSYNGWKNYETWNCALWITNDKRLYNLAKQASSYTQFIKGLMPKKTPDGVRWNDSAIDRNAIDQLINNINESKNP